MKIIIKGSEKGTLKWDRKIFLIKEVVATVSLTDQGLILTFTDMKLSKRLMTAFNGDVEEK
jgi:hypothetical protein